jgi:hypothetical protein
MPSESAADVNNFEKRIFYSLVGLKNSSVDGQADCVCDKPKRYDARDPNPDEPSKFLQGCVSHQ